MKRFMILAAAGAIASGAALSQGSSSTTSSGSSSQPSTAAAGASSSTVSKSDTKLITDLAQANMAEVQVGKMAMEKSQSDQVKQFAQKMVDDHGSALSELKAMAQSKGVKMPDDVGAEHKATETALKPLSGNTFDAQFMKRVGVEDHERTVKLLQKVQQEAQDPELKAMAGRMLPTVEHHLKMAQQTKASVDSNAKK